jgi:hypothetical protein
MVSICFQRNKVKTSINKNKATPVMEQLYAHARRKQNKQKVVSGARLGAEFDRQDPVQLELENKRYFFIADEVWTKRYPQQERLKYTQNANIQPNPPSKSTQAKTASKSKEVIEDDDCILLSDDEDATPPKSRSDEPVEVVAQPVPGAQIIEPVVVLSIEEAPAAPAIIATSSETIIVESESGEYLTCEACNERVLSRLMSEHEDFHYAQLIAAAANQQTEDPATTSNSGDIVTESPPPQTVEPTAPKPVEEKVQAPAQNELDASENSAVSLAGKTTVQEATGVIAAVVSESQKSLLDESSHLSSLPSTQSFDEDSLTLKELLARKKKIEEGEAKSVAAPAVDTSQVGKNNIIFGNFHCSTLTEFEHLLNLIL